MGFIPDGPEGEQFRKDMRALGAASSFATATSIGIFCTAKFAVGAHDLAHAGWLATGILGFGAAAGAMFEMKNYFNEMSKKKPPSPPAPPSPPSLKLGQPKL